MAPRALTIEEKRKRIRERTRKRRIQQRQHRQAQYEEECSHYSTVRRVSRDVDTVPASTDADVIATRECSL